MLKNFKNNRKIIRRKPGSKPSENYFSKETQAAILEYQVETDIAKKQKLYVEKILPAFDSLVENLINVYSFKVMYESKRDLKTECMEFLFTTVGKFDGTKGSKAFSYFNVVGKNWLIIKSKQNVKRIKSYISTDDKESFTNADIEQLESFYVVRSAEENLIDRENSKNLNKIIAGLEKRIKTENEQLALKAIREIVENIDNLDLLNKRACLLYIRELSGLSSKQLSVIISSLKKHYKEVKNEVLS